MKVKPHRALLSKDLVSSSVCEGYLNVFTVDFWYFGKNLELHQPPFGAQRGPEVLEGCVDREVGVDNGGLKRALKKEALRGLCSALELVSGLKSPTLTLLGTW